MRIHIVSAYPAVRAGLAALLAAQPGWTVTAGPWPDAEDPVPSGSPTTVPADLPDVLLLDAADPRALGGIAGVLDLLRPTIGIVVLGGTGASGRREPASEEGPRTLRYVAQAADAIGLVFGVLRRDAAVDEVVAALNAVAGGVIVLDRRLGPALVAPPEPALAASAERAIGDGEALTPRELEVLQLVAQGLPNKTIASRLHVSEHTAKFHVSSIMLKLGAASRTEAVTLAARKGLLIL